MDKSRVDYKVIPEHGIVIAEIDGCSFDAIKMINNRFMPNTTSSIRVDVNYFDEKFLMPNRFKAVAKCHPDDQFDEEVGKRIATDKLSDIYHRSLNNHFCNFMDVFYCCAEDICDYLVKRNALIIEQGVDEL